MQENNIEQWLNSLAGNDVSNSLSEECHKEARLLQAVILDDEKQQDKLFQNRAAQDWPALLERLNREKLLETPSKPLQIFNWLTSLFPRKIYIAFPAGAAVVAASLLLFFFVFPVQQQLDPMMSDNYTLYPHYRGGRETLCTITKADPAAYATDITANMLTHKIPYKLDRLNNGYQIEYYLPDTLPEAATQYIKALSLPHKPNQWHIVQIINTRERK